MLSIIDVHIKTFLDNYWSVYPNATITPKLHPLEDHMVPWIRRWGGVGFGVMGEQGAESIHAEFNLNSGTGTTEWKDYAALLCHTSQKVHHA